MDMTKLMEAIDGMGKGVEREVVYDRLIRKMRIGEVAVKHGVSIDFVRRSEMDCFRAYNRLAGVPSREDEIAAIEKEIEEKAKELGGYDTDTFKAWHFKRFGIATDVLDKIGVGVAA